MTKVPIPSGWNKRVQSAILQAISLGRHCFVAIVARMANSPKASERLVAENEHLKFEVESLREELRLIRGRRYVDRLSGLQQGRSSSAGPAFTSARCDRWSSILAFWTNLRAEYAFQFPWTNAVNRLVLE